MTSHGYAGGKISACCLISSYYIYASFFPRDVGQALRSVYYCDIIFLVKAKFHYASQFGAGSEHVRSWFVPNSITLAGSEPAPN